MECPNCLAACSGGEARCAQCGRRLHPAAPRSAPEGFVSYASPASTAATATATARALEAIPGGVTSQHETNVRAAASRQPSLFRDVVTGAKVIPIPTLTPLRMPGDSGPRRAHRSSGPRPSRRYSPSLQTQLFDPQAPAYASAGEAIHPNESIYCDAPVASPQHRLVAAAADAAVILIALGLFFAMFVLCGGEVVLNHELLMLLIGVGAVIALFYQFLWCLADGDTPGMRFAGLRLVDFDGRTPDREKRSVRRVAALLSLLSAGLGLVWALVDEENLTWHDHISKTFPTAG